MMWRMMIPISQHYHLLALKRYGLLPLPYEPLGVEILGAICRIVSFHNEVGGCTTAEVSLKTLRACCFAREDSCRPKAQEYFKKKYPQKRGASARVDDLREKIKIRNQNEKTDCRYASGDRDSSYSHRYSSGGRILSEHSARWSGGWQKR